jgi:class 3 adenylate cyclase
MISRRCAAVKAATGTSPGRCATQTNSNPVPDTFSFLFTDVEGSTRLWEQHPEAMQTALARHDAILREAIEAQGGHIVKTTGDGCHAVFETALGGVLATLAAQRALEADPWAALRPNAIRVRMGVHSGEAELRGGDYFGPAVRRY